MLNRDTLVKSLNPWYLTEEVRKLLSRKLKNYSPLMNAIVLNFDGRPTVQRGTGNWTVSEIRKKRRSKWRRQVAFSFPFSTPPGFRAVSQLTKHLVQATCTIVWVALWRSVAWHPTRTQPTVLVDTSLVFIVSGPSTAVKAETDTFLCLFPGDIAPLPFARGVFLSDSWAVWSETIFFAALGDSCFVSFVGTPADFWSLLKKIE